MTASSAERALWQATRRTYRGGILHYARAQELEPWLDLVAVRGEVVVQFLSLIHI